MTVWVIFSTLPRSTEIAIASGFPFFLFAKDLWSEDMNILARPHLRDILSEALE